jgi:hypothetical protein
MPSFLPLILKWVGESALIFFFLLHGSKEHNKPHGVRLKAFSYALSLACQSP